jgi:pseudoazurin
MQRNAVRAPRAHEDRATGGRLFGPPRMEKKMRISTLVAGAAAAALLAFPAAAKDVTVQMLNKGKAGMMVFEPALVKIVPGDTVTFVPTDKSHNVESIPGMIPAGAKPFRAAMSQPLKVTFTQAGVYGFKCMPHYAMGMVGLVVVGNPGANLAAAQQVNHPGKPKQVFTGLLSQTGVRMAAR